MTKTADIMGMPVRVNLADKLAKEKDIEEIFDYFRIIDKRFSTYKETSEISKINNGLLKLDETSVEMKKILRLCEETKKETNGYFDIEKEGKIDPSGIVKGFAIWQAALILGKKGYKNFYVEIAGDGEVCGLNDGEVWKVGIENPFNRMEIIKVVGLSNKGIATSGNYIRGVHIYSPITGKGIDDIASVTVIGDNVYEADRFATAAFAMGERGIVFLENKKGLEGYMVLKNKKAIYTSGFEKFVIS